MILYLDCGNTRLKWGLRADSEWLATGALPIAEVAQLIARLPPSIHIERAVGCIVAGASVRNAIEAAVPAAVEWNTSRDRQCGVSNGYEDPAKLGADRWAALIGARGLHQGPCLVISAGTATTIDVLDNKGMFQGGLILPGLELMRGALATNTAQLPAETGTYRTLPRNTRDAIASGAIHGTLGAIERLFHPLARQPDATCLFSGGAAESLVRHITLPHRLVHHLALEGLVRIGTAAKADL